MRRQRLVAGKKGHADPGRPVRAGEKPEQRQADIVVTSSLSGRRWLDLAEPNAERNGPAAAAIVTLPAAVIEERDGAARVSWHSLPIAVELGEVETRLAAVEVRSRAKTDIRFLVVVRGDAELLEQRCCALDVSQWLGSVSEDLRQLQAPPGHVCVASSGKQRNRASRIAPCRPEVQGPRQRVACARVTERTAAFDESSGSRGVLFDAETVEVTISERRTRCCYRQLAPLREQGFGPHEVRPAWLHGTGAQQPGYGAAAQNGASIAGPLEIGKCQARKRPRGALRLVEGAQAEAPRPVAETAAALVGIHHPRPIAHRAPEEQIAQPGAALGLAGSTRCVAGVDRQAQFAGRLPKGWLQSASPLSRRPRLGSTLHTGGQRTANNGERSGEAAYRCGREGHHTARYT